MSEQNQPSKFKPGDLVTWTSQAGGNSKTKQGIVVAVIPAEAAIRDALTAHELESWKLDRFFISISVRDHESYLIQVGKSKRLYWPLVKYLKPVESEPLDFEDEGKPYPGEGCGYDPIDSGPPSTWEEEENS